jgi:hypothetical protein
MLPNQKTCLHLSVICIFALQTLTQAQFSFVPLFVVFFKKRDGIHQNFTALFTLAPLLLVYTPTSREGAFLTVHFLSSMLTNARRFFSNYEALLTNVSPSAVVTNLVPGGRPRRMLYDRCRTVFRVGDRCRNSSG